MEVRAKGRLVVAVAGLLKVFLLIVLVFCLFGNLSRLNVAKSRRKAEGQQSQVTRIGRSQVPLGTQRTWVEERTGGGRGRTPEERYGRSDQR
jgi:hypothetical protein